MSTASVAKLTVHVNCFGVHERFSCYNVKWLKTTALVNYLPKKTRLTLSAHFFCQNNSKVWNKLSREMARLNDFNIFRGNLRRLFTTMQVEVF